MLYAFTHTCCIEHHPQPCARMCTFTLVYAKTKVLFCYLLSFKTSQFRNNLLFCNTVLKKKKQRQESVAAHCFRCLRGDRREERSTLWSEEQRRSAHGLLPGTCFWPLAPLVTVQNVWQRRPPKWQLAVHGVNRSSVFIMSPWCRRKKKEVIFFRRCCLCSFLRAEVLFSDYMWCVCEQCSVHRSSVLYLWFTVQRAIVRKNSYLLAVSVSQAWSLS